jgi:hypothetical protein
MMAAQARKRMPQQGQMRRPMPPQMAAQAMSPQMAMPATAVPGMKKGGKAEDSDMDMAQDKAMIEKAFKQHDAQEHKGDKGTTLKLKKGGMKKANGGYVRAADGCATKGKTKGRFV